MAKRILKTGTRFTIYKNFHQIFTADVKEVGYFRKLFSNGLMAGLFGCVTSNFLDLLKVRIIEKEG